MVVLSVAASTAQRSAREIGARRAMTFEELSRKAEGGYCGEIQYKDLRRLVLVVDEAAMADTRRLASLFQVSQWAEGGASLVLLGDERQLQPVGAGGGWLRLKEQAQEVGGYCELTETHRQRYQWEKQALDELRTGRGVEAIARYLVHDRIRITETRAEARELVAQSWNRARLAGEREGEGGRPLRDYVMVAATREDTQVLNQWAQGMRRQRGELGKGVTLHDRTGDLEVFQGDRVRLEGRLDRDHPNGIRGTVAEVSEEGEGGLRIRWDDPAVHPESLYRPEEHRAAGEGGEGGQRERGVLQLDYAGTTQRSQGVTAEQAFVLPGPQQGLEALYSAFSRARGETTVVLDRRTWGEQRSELGPQARETLDRATLVPSLAASASESQRKGGALDVGVVPRPRVGREARIDAAREKLLAYSRGLTETARQVAEERAAELARQAREPRHREQDHERYAREAAEEHRQAQQRGPFIGY